MQPQPGYFPAQPSAMALRLPPVNYGDGSRGGEVLPMSSRAPVDNLCLESELWQGRDCIVDGIWEDRCFDPTRDVRMDPITRESRCPLGTICVTRLHAPDADGRLSIDCEDEDEFYGNFRHLNGGGRGGGAASESDDEGFERHDGRRHGGASPVRGPRRTGLERHERVSQFSEEQIQAMIRQMEGVMRGGASSSSSSSNEVGVQAVDVNDLMEEDQRQSGRDGNDDDDDWSSRDDDSSSSFSQDSDRAEDWLNPWLSKHPKRSLRSSQ